MRGTVWKAALVVAVALVAGACASGSTETGTATTTTAVRPKSGGSLALGLETDPNGLDPSRNAFDAAGKQVASSIFDTWVSVGADGSIQPNLAEKLDHSDDYREWTIHIRPGVSFTDGTPLDADATVAVFKGFKDSAVTGTILSGMTAITKVDPSTVKLVNAEPWASFPYVLYAQLGMVASPKQLADPEGQSHPVGTGPFMLESWDINKTIKLVRNPNYWRKDQAGTPLPYLDAVTFNIIPDGAARITDLQSGTLDVIQARSISDTKILDGLADDPKFTITHDPGTTETAFIVLNTAKAPLDDVRVRQAIAHATDLATLAKDNGWPESKLTDSPFGPTSPWSADVGFPRYDLAKAKTLIDSYKQETGKDVTVELASPFDTTVLQQIAAQWAAAGITATVRILDARTTVLNAVFGQYDAIFFSYFATVDPDEDFYYWSSNSVAPVGAFSVNFARLTDSQIDEALDAARATPDVAERKAAYTTVQQRFADLVPYVWLYQLDWIIATQANVKQAANVHTADGGNAMPYLDGAFSLTETYIEVG